MGNAHLSIVFLEYCSNLIFHQKLKFLSYLLFLSPMIDQPSSIKIANKQEAAVMAEFMSTMAWETQNLKLDTKYVTKAVQYLMESDLGETLITYTKEKPSAALFLSFQNEEVWWIASVFVNKTFRGYGLFTLLFDYTVSMAKAKGVKYLRLYVEVNNVRAKKTYSHKGMYISDDKFFGYDLTYDEKAIQMLRRDDMSYTIKRLVEEPNLEGMEDICHRNVGTNKGLGCYFNGKLVGYCEFFHEFSEWRFGVTTYISTLFIRKNANAKKVMRKFFAFLGRIGELKVGALRIISKNDDELIFKLAQGIKKLNYEIMEIRLEPDLPKL